MRLNLWKLKRKSKKKQLDTLKNLSKKIICIDFDGVIHSYTSGYQGMGIISDPPVTHKYGLTSIEWLRTLIDDGRFDVRIWSARNWYDEGVIAMKEWFKLWGLTEEEVKNLKFPINKPAAWLTIDDRAVQFTGVFMSPNRIDKFKTWYG